MIAFEILPLRAYVGEILRGAADVNGSVSSLNQPPQLQEAEFCSNARIAIRCIKQFGRALTTSSRQNEQLAHHGTLATSKIPAMAQQPLSSSVQPTDIYGGGSS